MTTAIIIATGCSLIQEDVELCRGQGTIYAVKEAHRFAPWADYLYCGDYDWYDYYKGLPEFTGSKWVCCPNSAKKWGLNYIEPRNDIAWSFDEKQVATGGNSGFQTMNLATLHGHDTLILLGFDMKLTDKRQNFYKDARPKRTSNYNLFLTAMKRAADIIPAKVINCTRDTALECFPRMDLADALRLHGEK